MDLNLLTALDALLAEGGAGASALLTGQLDALRTGLRPTPRGETGFGIAWSGGLQAAVVEAARRSGG